MTIVQIIYEDIFYYHANLDINPKYDCSLRKITENEALEIKKGIEEYKKLQDLLANIYARPEFELEP